MFGVFFASAGLLIAGLYIESGPTVQNILVVHVSVGGLVGLGFGLMYLPAMDIVPHYFDRRLGLATGIAAAGSGVGQVVLAPVLHLGTKNLGLGSTLLCLAALVASAAAFALLYKLPKDWAEGNGYRGISPSSSRRPSAESMEPSGTEGAVVSSNALGEINAKSSAKTSSAYSLNLLLVSHFLFNIGIFTAFSFTTDRAVLRGLNGGSSSLLLSLMGVSNCFGRVVFGFLLDRFRTQAISLTVSVMVINSVSIISSDFLPDLVGQAIFSTIFGLTFGCYISSVMVVLSLTTASRSNLTNPLGLVLLTAGISSLAGPILAGALYDLTGSHRLGFLSCGGLATLGALLPLTLPIMQRPFRTPNKQCYYV